MTAAPKVRPVRAIRERTRVVLGDPGPCTLCPGDGVIRAKRPGVDWPTKCVCGAKRSALTNYTLGRRLGINPRVVLTVYELVARPRSYERVLDALAAAGLLA